MDPSPPGNSGSPGRHDQPEVAASTLRPGTNHVEPEGATPRLRFRWTRLRFIGYAVGAGLLIAAVAYVLRDPDAAAALRHARTAPWQWTVLLLLAPLASWMLTGSMMLVLTRRYARVGLGEMLPLVGASWLLNYLPLPRAGLIGRVAYLKAVHNMPVIDSMRVSLFSGGATLVAAAVGFVASVAHAWIAPSPEVGVALVIGLAIATAVVLSRLAKNPLHESLLLAVAFRIADMGLAAGRFALAFAMIGKPIDGPTATLLAGPSQVVGLLPIHLGTVEWAVGLLSVSTATGVTAAVLNRAADLVVSLPVGTLSLLALSRVRRSRAAGSKPTSPGR